MKKIISKIGFFIILFTIVGFNKTTVMAAGTSLGGTASATIGDTVSITVTANGDESIYAAEIGVSYDSSVLEFVNSNPNEESGGGGTVKIVKTGSGNSVSHTLKFKAISNGTASISVNAASIVYNSMTEVSLTGSSMSVNVSAPQTASANNSLKSLQISPGTLSPAFSSKTLSYSATVENSVTKIAVTAVPEDGRAQVTGVSGSGDLSVGANTVKIFVTAENGNVATYSIKVTREAASETIEKPTEEPEDTQEPEEVEEPVDEEEEAEDSKLEVTVGSQKLYIYNDFKEGKIPEGFEKSTSTYNNQEINVVKNSTGNLVLVYLVDENDENGAFYVYDETVSSFSEFIEVIGATNRYFIITPESSITIPTGYIETTIELDGKTVQAWYLDTDGTSGFYLVYAINWEGQKGFYQYDSVEGTFQRFVDTYESVATSATAEEVDNDMVTNLENKLNELQEKYDKDMSTRFRIISILAIVCFLLIICIVNLLFKVSNVKGGQINEEDEYMDDDYLDEEGTSEKSEKVLSESIKVKEVEIEKKHQGLPESEDDFDFIDLDDDK